MKKVGIYAVTAAFLMASLTGCETVKRTNNTQKGAGIGAVAGAVIGGVLGNNLGKGGNGALGAVLGGVVGGTVGGVIGNQMDQQAREIDNAVPGAQVERVGEGIKLTLGENSVRFDTGKSTLTPTAKANLLKLEKIFEQYPNTNITIYGYTDSTGRVEFNQKLSEQRAESVKQYLVATGIKAERISTQGMGVADPIATNDTPEGRAQNRRVEFAITANQQMIEEAQKQVKQ